MTSVHVLSVHYRHPEWVPLQRRYLDRNLLLPNNRLFSLEGVDESAFLDDEQLLISNDHYLTKFEDLSVKALDQADAGDWLLFIDSDAFLLADIRPLMELGTELVAVQRRENGDWHPHPCFTLVKADLWRRLGTNNWAEGTWVTLGGATATEMGGTLLERVTALEIPWTKLTRVNGKGLHRLWFGLYGVDGQDPVVYHHGAGSRSRVSRADMVSRRDRPRVAVERALWALQGGRRAGLGISAAEAWRGRTEELNRSVMAAIERDEDFWRFLI